MADDKATLLNEPGSQQASGRGSFTSPAAGTDRPRRRTNRATRVAVAVVLLTGVGAVAAFTGRSSGEFTVPIGAVRSAQLPAQVVFEDANIGYSLTTTCVTQTAGDTCPVSMHQTTDGGRTWTVVALPAGLPTDANLWGSPQASGKDLLLPYAYGSIVSSDGGQSWKTVLLHGSTATAPLGSFVVQQGAVSYVMTPTTAISQNLAFGVPVVGSHTAGMLPGGVLWLLDQTTFSVSPDQGKTWNRTPVSWKMPGLAMRQVDGKELARVTGPMTSATLGAPGNGGQISATTVMVSKDSGKTWTTRQLGGAEVNARCTVLLHDGTLLGLALDGKSLLRLAPGATSFVPLAKQPAAVPFCLQSNQVSVWGTTLDNKVVLTTDADSWSVRALSKLAVQGVVVAKPAAG